MLLHNTITGVIAAVMVALGAGQIGNTSTQVGEELVVKEMEQLNKSTLAVSKEGFFSVHENIRNTVWVEVFITDTSDEENPENQEVINQGQASNCEPENNGQICSVELDLGLADENEVADLMDKINDPSAPNPTIQDFLDLQASALGHAYRP